MTLLFSHEQAFAPGRILGEELAERLAFHHLRDKDGYEVDVVVQRGSRYVGVEVKAANSVHEGDFRGIKRLRELLGPQSHAGIVLYDGEHVLPFGDQLLAVPLSALWARKQKTDGKRKAAARRSTPES
jgi:predicted AAA+ superfamily ATPase